MWLFKKKIYYFFTVEAHSEKIILFSPCPNSCFGGADLTICYCDSMTQYFPTQLG